MSNLVSKQNIVGTRREVFDGQIVAVLLGEVYVQQ